MYSFAIYLTRSELLQHRPGDAACGAREVSGAVLLEDWHNGVLLEVPPLQGRHQSHHILTGTRRFSVCLFVFSFLLCNLYPAIELFVF
jgi:hypothetical protein